MKRVKVTRHYNWRRFRKIISIILVVCAVTGLVITLGTDVTKKQYEDVTGFKTRELPIEATDYGYKITNPYDTPLRILQITDIHIGGGLLSIKNDRLAIQTILELVEYTKPDLIIATGDLVYPVPFQSGTINNMVEARIFGGLMEKMGIPWVVTFGNHDTESYSMYNRADLTDYYSSLKNCLLVRGPTDIFGYGNQIITIHNADGELNTALVLLDSNAYRKEKIGINKYDYIHDDQVDWYVRSINELSEGKDEVIQSLMFFHIPLIEYNEAWQLKESESDEIEYHFGINREKVSSSDLRSKIFEAAYELGSTKAMFCGHDHVNYSSITYKGIRLTYGKSIDYLAYAWSGIINQTDQRGGTVIDISSDKSFDISTVRYSDIKK